MSGKVYFVSGGNRGIGLEFVKQLSSDASNTVIATAREPEKADELIKLVESQKNIHVVKLDVSSKASFDELDSQLKEIAKGGIDVLISNAGIAQSYKSLLKTTDEEIYLRHFKVNALGPVFLVQALYKYLILKKTRHIAFVSSLAGSINSFIPMSSSAYGQSKAALNYTIKEFSFELASEGFVVVAVHPGLVDTDMGRTSSAGYAQENPAILEGFKNLKILSAAESAEKQLTNTILNLTTEKNGKFYNEDGIELQF